MKSWNGKSGIGCWFPCMNYASTYSFLILSLLQYQTIYCLPKIQLLPIIHLNHNSLLLYESSFASKKWSFQFMIDIKMAILINSSL